MKKIILLVFLFVFSFSFAQSLNEYKYALVPSKFSFLKGKDDYKLNTLTKLFMEKYGFTTYLDTDVLPDEVLNNNCNKVYVDVTDSSNFLTTKVKVVLKDCKGNILFTSAEGKSKEKEYRVSYNQALRAAFQSFETLKHKYSPVETAPIPIKPEIPNVTTIIPAESSEDNIQLVYAQPIQNGYQLVDATPKVILKIFKTSIANTFSALKGTTQGVFILKDSKWFFEYYENEKLISEIVNVKF